MKTLNEEQMTEVQGGIDELRYVCTIMIDDVALRCYVNGAGAFIGCF